MQKLLWRISILLLACGFALPLSAQEGPAPKADAPSSLDAQLLDDLDNELLEDLGDNLGDAGAKKPQAPAPRATEPAQPPSPLDEKLLDNLGEDIGAPDTAADDSPLIRIEQMMRQVEQRLAQRDPSDETQTLQRNIAQELAALLEQLQQQQQQQQQQNQNNSSQQQQQQQQASSQQNQEQTQTNPANQAAKQPARESEERLGKVEDEKINPEDLQELFQRAWGHLPPQLREQMQAAAQEQFLPKYQTLIEDYYRRLAKEGRR